MRCEVCGADNRSCGHQKLRLPVVDLAPHNGGAMQKHERPTLVRPFVRRSQGVAGWRNATIVEPGTEGIPIAPEPEDSSEAAAAMQSVIATSPRAIERRPKGRARPVIAKE
jgi:hypothetical protein